MKKKLLFFIIAFAACSYLLQAQNILLVKEVNTNANGSSFPNNFTECAGKLYFFASDNTGTKYLWSSLGTDITTTNIGPFTGINNSLSSLFSYNGKLFFSYSDGINGYELWTSDGTSGGTVLFKDLNTGAGNAFPAAFTVCNNKLFFAASDNSGLTRLFVSDGTAAGTINIRNASLLGGQTSLAVLNNDVYFLSDDGSGSGNGLWKSDGTVGGTVLVKAGIVSTAGIPGYSAVLNNNLYFNASDATTGNELWVSNGTTVGTHIVKNLRADAFPITASGNPQNLLVYNNKLYFAASDDTHGTELFVSDGTNPGTTMVKDIIAGAGGSQPYKSTLYNGLLYFTCWASNELWKTDGTDPGTQLVKGSLFTAPKFAAAWNNKMYLIFGGSNYNLWESDGTTAGTKAIQPQNTSFPVTSYTDFGSDAHFTEFNSELYFNGRCFLTADGFEPVKLAPAVVLAVTWLGVQAQWESSFSAKISWQVTEKQNTKDYTIQHSRDAVAFTDVATFAATNSNHYSGIVPADAGSKNYYRVFETDISGAKNYSGMVALQKTTAPPLAFYPNPVTDQLYITTVTAGNSISITDITGRIVLQQKISTGFRHINTKHLSPGVYALTVMAGNKKQIIQFLKQ